MAGKKKEEVSNPSGNWGGRREGAGRPTKEKLMNVKSLMDEHIDENFAMQKLFELIDKGDLRAVDLYMKYRFGTPTQQIDMNLAGSTDINLKLSNLIQFGETEDEGQDS